MRLETERLVLRKPELDDLDGYVERVGRPRSDAVPRRADAAARTECRRQWSLQSRPAGTARGSVCSAFFGRRTSGSSGGSAISCGTPTVGRTRSAAELRGRSRARDRLDGLERLLGQRVCDRGRDRVSRPRVLRARESGSSRSSSRPTTLRSGWPKRSASRTNATSSSAGDGRALPRPLTDR